MSIVFILSSCTTYKEKEIKLSEIVAYDLDNIKPTSGDDMIFYDNGKTIPSEYYDLLIENIANILNRNPSILISIEGHSDNCEPINEHLSYKRGNYLYETFIYLHVNKNQIRVISSDDNSPFSIGNDGISDALNRRVGIIYHEKQF